MQAARTQAAVLAGKLTRRAARALGGGGTALPGLVGERVDRNLVARLAAQLDGAVLISGTNGKTTTARMLAGILTAAGRPVVHNRAGSNLMRGIAAALIEAADPWGKLPPGRLGVFETDEATLPAAAAAVPPRVLAISNLLRDQLDRYGEIEAIRARWRAVIRALPPTTVLVLNADDPSVATLAEEAPGAVLLFGIDDVGAAVPAGSAAEHAADALWDPDSGADYVYERRFYAHLGHWRTPGGGPARPPVDVRALDIVPAAEAGTMFVVARGERRETVRLPLKGLYNVYNALAAAAAAQALAVDLALTATALSEVRAVFGRQERLQVEGHSVTILLGKNPAGLNQALGTLLDGEARSHLLVLLNDKVADGTDVSWIWDTDWERLAPRAASLVVGGRRAADMALRLRYAGFPEPAQPIHHEIGAALLQALQALPPGAPLVVVPTYTALLAVRERLGRLAGAPRIWEGA